MEKCTTTAVPLHARSLQQPPQNQEQNEYSQHKAMTEMHNDTIG
jgi:hypothetical protein